MVYRYATGWLGWDDHAAMTTPIARILLAMDGKAEFLRITNGVEAEPEPVSPDDVANKLRVALAQAGPKREG
ncbi:hypothetical protein [Thalassospira sp. MCCC 1A01428]|uniref:hypothetical protein n=1 Tax=Thalassospira sp. MCCC 1A01428 TaxID=1470575 RepID=UPI000A1F951A|nr:hypothetical protein [Thalassospira sp. MCCC 1A01428]OSQ33816.1 hypothetical protein THS27_25885 [Thalassospira sp. MCCC 1A01428]